MTRLEPAVLIANRGEIAARIINAVHVCGMRAVAITTADEPEAPHAVAADALVTLDTRGAAAYLDTDALIKVALGEGCSFVHPGYGFLSENASAARAFHSAGIVFVGPEPDTLELLGDKVDAKRYAASLGIPVLESTGIVENDADGVEFMRRLGGAVIVKAVAGGGGRGMRVVRDPARLPETLRRARSEAEKGFGRGDVTLEHYIERARHIEVQLVGDGSRVLHLGTRDCSVQRRHQKVIEIAPAQGIDDRLADRLCADAVRLGEAVNLRGLATVEFLVDMMAPERYTFIEANPRLQVEHGVTELVTGVDLVATQLEIARGRSLLGLGIPQSPRVRGCAMEARVSLVAAPGPVAALMLPSGTGIRVDTALSKGVRPALAFDPLVAKVLIHEPSGAVEVAADRLAEALRELTVDGITLDTHTDIGLLGHPAVRTGAAWTTLVDDAEAVVADVGEEDLVVARSPGTVVSVLARSGQSVAHRQPLVVVEAMKMEREYLAPRGGEVVAIDVEVGDLVEVGAALARVRANGADPHPIGASGSGPASGDRPDIEENRQRHARTRDQARPEAVRSRHARGKRTARENVAAVVDEGSFVEYGPLVIAAQRTRRTLEDLEAATPADGLVAGFGHIDADTWGAERTTAAVLAFDYTVFAGTQGLQGHRKAERIFELAHSRRVPVVIFAEGGGGRPGDTDNAARATGMDLGTFAALGRVAGAVPTVGIASGRCFAGSAALFGACELTIATADANIGLGGPAMIEGGGLGRVSPDDIGPASEQAALGVVDVLVEDEAEAAAVARSYLGYFSGVRMDWHATDQTALNAIVPERRTKTFDIRELIRVLADVDSTLEVGAQYAPAIVTALARVEGRTVGIIANDGEYLGGAIDAAGASKMAAFLERCERRGIPVVTLCDTPGFMVGPDSERHGPVRAVGRLFAIGANLTVPLCTIIVRRAFGLGAQAMAGGSFRVPRAVLAWPTAELGAMGPEGAVRLAYRRELESITDEEERQREFTRLVAEYIAAGKAYNAASVFELDDVIDPSETRHWIARTLGP